MGDTLKFKEREEFEKRLKAKDEVIEQFEKDNDQLEQLLAKVLRFEPSPRVRLMIETHLKKRGA